MADTREEADRLREAAAVLIESEAFGEYCENANYHSLVSFLDEFRDDVHVHEWSDWELDSWGDDIEIGHRTCSVCKYEQCRELNQ